MNEMPDCVKKYKSRDVEIRKFDNKYYAYSVSSKYDKNNKRAQKITEKYLEIVIESWIFKKSTISIFHTEYCKYSALALLYSIAEK
jgi:hypothetical protein